MQQSRNALIAFMRGHAQLYGAGTVSVGGFECTPGNGLQVVVAPGVLVLPGTVDDTAYGSLPPDESPLPRQYVMADPSVIAISPGTYTVYVTGKRIDQGLVSLPYYNPQNPSQTLAGPTATGSAQATVRSDVASVALSPVGNTPPAGGIAVATVSVPDGSTSVSQPMIAAVAPSAAGPSFPTIGELAMGRVIGMRVITAAMYAAAVAAGASGVINVPSGGTRLTVARMGAPGGSGGSAGACGPSQAAVGGGASGGAYADVLFPAESLAGATFVVPYGAPAPIAGTISGNNASPLEVIGASGQVLVNLPGGVGGGSASPGTTLIAAGAGTPGQVMIANGYTLAFSLGGTGDAGFALNADTTFFGYGGKGGRGGFGEGAGAAGQNTAGYGANMTGGGGGACTAPNGQALAGGAGGEARIVLFDYA